MITAAAPALSPVQASVTSMPGQRGTARSAATATCGYATKVTIYNCRISHHFGECCQVAESGMTEPGLQVGSPTLPHPLVVCMNLTQADPGQHLVG
jgi:hypothetical protein